jgi:hypothetical protein
MMDKIKTAYKWFEDAIKWVVEKGAAIVVQYPKTTVVVFAVVALKAFI